MRSLIVLLLGVAALVETRTRANLTVPVGGHIVRKLRQDNVAGEGRTVLLLARAVLGPPRAEPPPAKD